nr:MAG TPA: Protein of unknown function (DUF2612) [Caudoviricetes sp.]
MNIFNEWIKDIPEQYRGKRRIETLIKAFSKQIDELLRVFDDMNKSTVIDTAKGANLDYIGNIVSLARKDMPLLFKNPREVSLDDSLYRQAIKYKSLRNTSECTYEDIIASLSLLWKTEQLSYSEPIDKIATICIRMADFDIDIEDPATSRAFAIKPAGVALIYFIGYLYQLDNRGKEITAVKQLFMHYKQNISNSHKKIVTEVKMHLNENNNGIKVTLASKSGKKNLWYLDGKYLLDGVRILNSTHKLEEI